MIRRLLLFIMWFVALPFLSLQAQSPGGVVRTAEGDSTMAANQAMRVVTFQGGAGDGAIVYFGKFYNGIDKEDSFVEHQLSIEIIEDVK